MNVLQAIVLGAIQGLTEFIPISSSAHLAIIPWIMKWETPGLTFDVSLHLGTLIALLVYFWRDWYNMIRSYISSTKFAKASASSNTSAQEQANGFLVWPIVVACIPAVVVGVGYEDLIEIVFRDNPVVIAIPMILLGIILFFADKIGKKSRPIESIKPRDWIIIGMAQALAIIPGVSRSGVTITAGLFCGLKREASARFSFLLGSPIIFGAAAYKLMDVAKNGLPTDQVAGFIAGVAAATIIGYLCIGFLLDYLKKHSMGIFVAYRILFGIGMILIYTLNK